MMCSNADLIAVDSVRSVRDLSTEFRNHFKDNENAWKSVETIASLIAENRVRPDGADVTLYKAMGMGLSDLALAIEIFKRAQKENKGHKLPERTSSPRLI